MMVFQHEVKLKPRNRGFHVITDEILGKITPDLHSIFKGLCHVFIQHTSAGLSINENYDPDVRHDFETHFNRMVPEDTTLYRHTLEGTDDMTSHIKSSIIGHQVTVPITNGRLNLGTWQGIYLCEYRNVGGPRRIVVTITGLGS